MLVGANTVLEADDLTVELGGLPLLRGVSLSARAGEALALMGGNGSGKSTLVRALLGLLPHQRGAVRLFSLPLRNFRQWSRVGYVPQRSIALLGGSKVKEVVAAGRLAHRRPFRPLSRADREAIHDAIAQVGLSEELNTDIAALSGGQQQRVLVARALAGNPDLLVLDEPTSGVDLEHQGVLADVLAGRLSAGAAVLVVLHDVGALGDLIDRAVVLRDGRVAHDGPLGDLGQHHRRLGGHEYLDHGRVAADDHGEGAASWLGGAVEP
ncbi:MAG TPA: ATP-binding cassette domain-containing protein [Propionibacteriaceae bacterium]|nr:ATP-binding cassette domain-containing protein [Propionibacteriaceae bacterium]